MAPEEFKRKLSAILSADVEGYSRLMGEDEDATIRTLTSYRELMATLIQKHRGRVVDSPGDNLLAEFGSVVDAVRCAVEIQEELRVRNAELPENRRMHFRIGINLGDVVEEGERIYGDGVNIAARVEGLAEGGGICISGTVYDHIKNKLSLSYESLGEHTVKNIKEPVRVYRMRVGPEATTQRENRKKRWGWPVLAGVIALILVVGAAVVWNFYLRRPTVEAADPEKMAFPLPDKPSIAVLPFTNMSGDPEQNYIGDGLSENIISALSVSPGIFVIARNSTFTYKGKPVKVQQVAEELGVQYVLEGSIQKSGDRLRVTAQFIDALNGHHLWSEVYNREMKDLFEMQDEITKKIVVSLAVELGGGETVRLFAKSTDNLEAWKHFVKGTDFFFKLIKEDRIKAREHFETAINIDPEYAGATTLLAWTHALDAYYGGSNSPSLSLKRAFEFAQKALKLDEQDPLVHNLLATLFWFQRQYEKAIAEHKRTIALNPNYDSGYAHFSGFMHYYGRFEESISLYKKAYRLNPKILPIHLRDLAMSYIFLERYEEALEVIRQMDEHIQRGDAIPKSMPLLFYSWVYHELDREEEASAYMAEALEISPNLSIEFVKKNTLPYKNPAHLQRMLDAYRKSGMPEHPPLPLPDKPSIAVLPFTNMSGDPDQDYIGDGLSENIISALSISSKLFVIARNSTFTYKGKPVKVQHVARDLGVQYVLEGSIQKSGDRLRVTAQLIDALSGHHLWSEKYDRKMKELFDLQDEITKKILVELQVELTRGEVTRIAAQSTNNLEAWKHYIKGLDLFLEFMRENNFIKAQKHFKTAMNLDPDFVSAVSWLAWTHMIIANFGLSDSPEISYKSAFELLQKALKMDDQDPIVHMVLGHFYLYQENQHEKAIIEGKKAITLNPNFGLGHAMLGSTMSYSGRFEEAIALVKKAYRLNPKLLPYWLTRLSNSYIFLGHYEDALGVIYQMEEHASKGNLERLWVLLDYSFLYHKLGREEKARAYMAEALNSNPEGSLEMVKLISPYKNPVHLQRLLEAYRESGLPEKPPRAIQ